MRMFLHHRWSKSVVKKNLNEAKDHTAMQIWAAVWSLMRPRMLLTELSLSMNTKQGQEHSWLGVVNSLFVVFQNVSAQNVLNAASICMYTRGYIWFLIWFQSLYQNQEFADLINIASCTGVVKLEILQLWNCNHRSCEAWPTAAGKHASCKDQYEDLKSVLSHYAGEPTAWLWSYAWTAWK